MTGYPAAHSPPSSTRVDFLKSPSSCLFSTCRTKDFSYSIAANFSDPKNRLLGFDQSEFPWVSLGDRTVKHRLLCTTKRDLWLNSIWGRLRKLLNKLHSPQDITYCVTTRRKQWKYIWSYLSGRDVFVSTPTGAGKSLTFELAPYAFDCFNGDPRMEIKRIATPSSCCRRLVVLVQLISLIKDQVSQLF